MVEARTAAAAALGAAVASACALPVGCGREFAAPATDWAFHLGAARELKVLYAGVPAEPRGERFVSFLAATFTTVEAIDLDDLTAETAAHHDVVVADWHPRWKDGGYQDEFKYPEVRIPRTFTTPIALLSNSVVAIQEWGTKLRPW